jgi:hypothetical protein
MFFLKNTCLKHGKLKYIYIYRSKQGGMGRVASLRFSMYQRYGKQASKHVTNCCCRLTKGTLQPSWVDGWVGTPLGSEKGTTIQY